MPYAAAMHRATCSCGQLELTYDRPITRTAICHCLACQRRTGSAYGVQARLDAEGVKVTGEVKAYTRVGDAGGRIDFQFCPRCGATVCWSIDTLPGAVIIAAGALAGEDLPAPTFSVYEDRMLPWVQLPESVETHWR